MNLAKMLRSILLSITLFLGCDTQADSYLDKIFPGNVRLGEPLADFRVTHDKAIIMKTISKKEDSYDFGEMPSRTDLRMYYFRKGRLAGYMKLTRAAQLDTKLRQEEADVANPEKSGEFIKNGTSQAARATKDLRMETIEVVNWKSKTTPDLELYTVDSPSEITVIAFESSHLSWKDFFVGPEIKDKLEASRQHIEKVLSDANAQKRLTSIPASQASSTPKSSATPALSPPAATVTTKKPSNNFPFAPMTILAALVAAAFVFFLRRKSR